MRTLLVRLSHALQDFRPSMTARSHATNRPCVRILSAHLDHFTFSDTSQRQYGQPGHCVANAGNDKCFETLSRHHPDKSQGYETCESRAVLACGEPMRMHMSHHFDDDQCVRIYLLQLTAVYDNQDSALYPRMSGELPRLLSFL